jgi:phosphate transport system substrate-binding protein
MLRLKSFSPSLLLISLSLFIQISSAHCNQLFKFSATKRNQISMVGSSTVYPFAATIAEEFGRNAKSKKNNQLTKTPIVESTGTGGGFKLFCSGIGYQYPDFINASREIQKSEIAKCAENKISDPVEIKIGYDGIVLANSVKGKNFSLTKNQIFLALADKVFDPKTNKLVDNFYKKWSEIDENLPNVKILVYGPPSSSGTRDAFVELVMEESCIDLKEMIDAYPDKKIRQKKCHLIRSDGVFVEAGENDNLIVQKLINDSEALGIFGFSFLEENHDYVKAALIDDVVANFDNIANNRYKVSRPLFIYFKKEHLDLIPNMREFISEIISPEAIGIEGYLLQKGLIPLNNSELKKVRENVGQKLANN